MLDAVDTDRPPLELLPIPQLVATATVEARTMLPSFLYLAAGHEVGGGALDLPWAADRDFAIGEFARRQSAEMPDRTVAAAKSWLCHSRVDRRQPILPWNAPAEVPKVSPVTASQRYIEHLVAAWETAHPDAPMAEQHVVLTVPASFDASARELTREAAIAAGLPSDLVLLEEPQAAVYAWLATTGDRWRRRAFGGRYAAGVRRRRRHNRFDVGRRRGGARRAGAAADRGRQSPAGGRRQHGPDPGPLRRRPVRRKGRATRSLAIGRPVAFVPGGQGNAAAPELRGGGGSSTATPTPATANISVLGRGRKLIGGTVSVEVDRRGVSELLVDGFFPVASRPTGPCGRASGFREIGLPFESDTAITRHLAAFLQAHGTGRSNPVRPTHVLFNGGVFKADVLRGGSWRCWANGSAANCFFWGGGVFFCQSRLTRTSGRRTRPRSCGCPRGRLLRLDKTWRGRADSRRHGPGVLRGHRDGRIGRAGGAAAVAGTVRRAHRHGGRHRDGRAVRRDWTGGGRAGPLPLLQFLGAEGRSAGRLAEHMDARKRSPRPIRWRPICRPTSRWTSRTCPFVSVLGCTELGVLELWCVGTASQKRWKLEFSVREEAM